MVRWIALLLPLTAAPVCAAAQGYLFVTFKGEQTPRTEQIYFAASRDGREWQALNGGEPVLVSDLGERGVRDPFILRSPDGGKFFLIATDLSINLNRDWRRAVRAGSKSIVVWESEDLATWSEPRLVKVAPDDAGCTWAPEAIYDESTQDYLVFWASTTGRDDFAKHRIWSARTKDFRTFSEPEIFIEKPNTAIDTTIVRDDRKYYRFTKDEKFKAITQETSDALAGPWTDVADFSLAKMTGFEGPTCFRMVDAQNGEPGKWCLLLDHYARGEGYKPFVTDDLASGNFAAAPGIKFPFKLRHGSVLPVSVEELERIEAAFPGEK
ncbi:MAG TPA: glycoside hydrolase family 43 protein [Lacipirellulaceae bacterium]|nr:glycoside hydrolase family 43 protein [Lacipirellulaceae bacterium]